MGRGPEIELSNCWIKWQKPNGEFLQGATIDPTMLENIASGASRIYGEWSHLGGLLSEDPKRTEKIQQLAQQFMKMTNIDIVQLYNAGVNPGRIEKLGERIQDE